MANNLEISFNSPQCGWMSIGFDDGANEFHTTTAHHPHEKALAELLRILTNLLDANSAQSEYVLHWNRSPEEFDFRFVREGEDVTLEIYQYPTEEREAKNREKVFAHLGNIKDVCQTFAETFNQLYADRETDEFEFNWRQPFPFREYEEFKKKCPADERELDG
jgi:predicted HNH restriction endonuclease